MMNRMSTETSPKIALVTGASRGLGASIALELSRTHHIVAVGKTVGALEELDDQINEIGGQATLAPMDITVESAMQQLYTSIQERWGRINLWIHSAIYAAPLAPASDILTKDFDKSVETNIHATARLIQYMEPLLGPKGRAVFFDDPRAGEKFFGTYGATKAAQIAIARSWQIETSRIGPTVKILSPKPMPTAVRARFFPGEDRSNLTDTHSEAARLLTDIID